MSCRTVALLACLAASTTHAASVGLGTSAALSPAGDLWIAHTQDAEPQTHVVVTHRDVRGAWSAPLQVTPTPEAVSADGENRPKIALGPSGEIYVSWTSPTSAHYTANIRFARSLDDGRTWSTPITVHHDRQLIAHRFESLLVDGAGALWLAWIDKRDLTNAQAAQHDYAGAAVYYARSTDRGATWSVERKLADHSCECCRIALALDQRGRATAMWRHVFANDERDHALAVLSEAAPSVERVTHDRWRVAACPHHGPSLAIDVHGRRHAVWFNQIAGEGRAFYGRLGSDGPTRVRALPAGAAHADVAVADGLIAVAWKRFDGSATRVESWLSRDDGASFSPGPTWQTRGVSDQPRLLANGRDIMLVWRRAEGVLAQSLVAARAERVSSTSAAPAPAASAHIKPFGRDSLAQIERANAGRAFWLVLWDLECGYCMTSLKNLAAAQRRRTDIKVVAIATDSISQARELQARLGELGIAADAYAFSEDAPEALRYAIDPAWAGEKPRAYRYDPRGERRAVTGVIEAQEFAAAM